MIEQEVDWSCCSFVSGPILKIQIANERSDIPLHFLFWQLSNSSIISGSELTSKTPWCCYPYQLLPKCPKILMQKCMVYPQFLADEPNMSKYEKFIYLWLQWAQFLMIWPILVIHRRSRLLFALIFIMRQTLAEHLTHLK